MSSFSVLNRLRCHARRTLIGIFASIVVVSSGIAFGQAIDAPPVFEKDVFPIFEAHCIKCHKPENAESGLNVTTGAAVIAGGEAGPVLVRGSAEKSVLFTKILDRKMPPPEEKNPLGDDEIALIRKWIDRGAVTAKQEQVAILSSMPVISAEDRNFWSFRRPVAAPVPTPAAANRVRTAVDAFLLKRLEEKGLSFSTDAPARTLARRAYLDLLGLPPTPEEMRSFVNDADPDGYDKLIDKLLDRPEYGERWGRHWLDTAGYTDAPHCDAQGNLLPIEDWRYRDYVVQAFNKDKPYDRFLMEQLAGDELVPWRTTEKYTPEIVEALTATGYLRTPPDWTHSIQETIVSKYRIDVLSRVVDHVSSGVIGMTMACARCHTHKFDPIPHQDYYRMTAVFATAYNLEDWKRPVDRFLPDVSKSDQETIERHNAQIDGLIDEQNRRLEELRRGHRPKLFEEKLATVPEPLRDDVKAAFDTAGDKRDEVQRYLVKKFTKLLTISNDELRQRFTAEEKAVAESANNEIAKLKGSKQSFRKLQALFDVGAPPTIRLLYRGDADTPGPAVEAGFISVLCEPDKSAATRPAETPENSSGRRLALAKWIANREHPLTARVMVNRIWQHHFGKGIVTTPDNFGRSGVPPTHPELLDWLAVDFMEHGWGMKRLHKLLMTSTAYRQSAYEPANGPAVEADHDNQLLWRMNLRRLEAELIRDSVLAVSGKLDRTFGGPPVPVDARQDGLVLVQKGPHDTSQFRRSMYLMSQRGSHASGKGFMLSMLEIFDFPEIVINCTRRSSSTTPLQSLALINSDFMTEQAQYFAERVQSVAGPEASLEKQVRTAFALTFGRPPSATELNFCIEHLRRQTELYSQDASPANNPQQKALTGLCLMLLASNEFIYIG